MTEEEKYQQGKIYTIRSSKTSICYVGSTYLTLSERLRKHKNDFSSWILENRGYVTSFELLKFDDCKIELIKDYPCTSKTELEKEEGKYQLSMDCVNKNIAGRTKEEYYEHNKTKIDAYRKKWYNENKEHVKKYKAELYLKNREKEQVRQAEYYQQNKEKAKQRAKEHIERNSNIIECECGSRYKKVNHSKHITCKKHQDFINGVELPPLKPNQKECECGSRYMNTTSERNQHLKTNKHKRWLEKQEYDY